MPIPRFFLTDNVFDAALDRMVRLYEEGHRIVVSFSGGKDSGALIELCILAARATGRLPIEVSMRDDEIMFPGTFEYSERVAARFEVDFTWIVANQPCINMFNRKAPYFWCFDKSLPSDQWVREPPSWATHIKEQHIEAVVHPDRYPPDAGKKLIAVIGLRVQESQRRRRGLYSSGGYMTGQGSNGVYKARPIYDWTDGDIWKAHRDFQWDYNSAYDIMHRLGVNRSALRIAPPTQTIAAVDALWVAARAWPKWFDKVCERLPGVRTAAMFRRRSVTPYKRLGQTWMDVYLKDCIAEAPDWIARRSQRIMDHYLGLHSRHSNQPFPDVMGCSKCGEQFGSWKRLALVMYMGDPFSMKQSVEPYMEPEFFREGAGYWGGKPTF